MKGGPLELPLKVAQAFAKNMRAYFAEQTPSSAMRSPRASFMRSVCISPRATKSFVSQTCTSFFGN
jgi:hypothetical protein